MSSFLLQLKCKRYWPESKDEILTFAGLEISLVSSEVTCKSFRLLPRCLFHKSVHQIHVSFYCKGSNPASMYSGLKVYFWLWEHLCDQV